MLHKSHTPLRHRIAGSAVGLVLIVLAWPGLAEPVTEGCLRAYHESESLGYCPLKHTDVSVDIAGFLARVTVVQEFTNPWPEDTGAIEAVYTFPLSARAAVDRMTMQVGDRTIRGVVKEREAARRAYEQAKAAGQAASLLDQERPNIFTQSVANIMPGQDVKITISYVEYLPYENGEYTFAFPMVVGPRYIPGGNQVPDAGNITPPITPKGTRAGHDISLNVRLDAGVPIRKMDSVLHAVQIDRPLPGKANVALKNQKNIPNRDFILKYTVAAKQMQDSFMAYRDERGGFFSLILLPPEKVAPREARPKEMIFVIDCSGSMGGFPIEKAKATMRRCIEQMNPNDTFNLISFAGGTGYCFKKAVPNSVDNRRKALAYLSKLQGGGGTEMMGAIRAALGGPYNDDRLRIVCFMTDGYIGNDMAILDEIQKTRRDARVFAFGIGNSVNTFLIEGMGREGRGASEIVTLESDGDKAVERFHQRIQSPVLTDITLDFGGLSVEGLFPAAETIPDLFSKQPLIITGRYTKPGKGTITLRGNTGAGDYEKRIKIVFPKKAPDHDVLASLWARTKIDTLMARDWNGMQQGTPRDKLKQKITRLGIDYQLMTQFTSFVAVEEKVINEGGVSKRVDMPVEMPDGVSYEGIFGDEADWLEMSLGTRSGAAGGASMGRRGAVRYMKMAPAAPMPAAEPAPIAVEAPKPARKYIVQEATSMDMDLKVEEVAEAEDRTAASTLAKLDPALQGLAAKVVNGSYRSDKVTVENGKVKVLIHLSAMDQKHLDTLRAFGVKIIAENHAGQKLLVKVPVSDLEALVKQFAFITKITPPTL